jgi:ectoine hydroxylase-related dioxygenase (phytanoyl-CoA dioxygenase family)
MQYLNELYQNGYLIVRGLIPREDVNFLVQSFRKTFADQLNQFDSSSSIKSNDLASVFQSLYNKDEEVYKKVLSSLWRKLDCYNLAHHLNIVNFIKTQLKWSDIYIPGGQVVHVMSDELKIKNGYFGLAPHQDFPSVQGSLDGLVCWIPLVDVTKNNYPIEVIPGSHLGGLRYPVKNSKDLWELTLDESDKKNFIPVEVEVGDVVFMTGFTIHRSSENGRNFRLAISTRFDNGDEASFVSRQYPSAYVRTVRREQYLENFPDIAQVNHVFNKYLAE